MKARLIFIAISSVVYPLLWMVVPMEGMLLAIAVGVAVLSVSVFMAHRLFRTWWLALCSAVVGIAAIWGLEWWREWRELNQVIPYQQYYSNGELRAKGNYIGVDSLLHGQIYEYTFNGVLLSVKSYDRGVQNGPCEIYYGKGVLRAKGSVAYEKYDGVWKFYYRDGTLEDERQYKDHTLIRSKSYTLVRNADSVIRIIADAKPYTGVLDKTPIVENPTVIEYNDIYPKVYDGKVVDGRFEGTITENFLFNGKTLLSSVTCYLNGHFEGRQIYYFSDGSVQKEENYKDGLAHGKWVEYDKRTGELLSVYHYDQGQKHGEYEIFNKKLSGESGRYCRGEHVSFKRYNAYGQVIETQVRGDDGQWKVLGTVPPR